MSTAIPNSVSDSGSVQPSTPATSGASSASGTSTTTGPVTGPGIPTGGADGGVQGGDSAGGVDSGAILDALDSLSQMAGNALTDAGGALNNAASEAVQQTENFWNEMQEQFSESRGKQDKKLVKKQVENAQKAQQANNEKLNKNARRSAVVLDGKSHKKTVNSKSKPLNSVGNSSAANKNQKAGKTGDIAKLAIKAEDNGAEGTRPERPRFVLNPKTKRGQLAGVEKSKLGKAPEDSADKKALNKPQTKRALAKNDKGARKPLNKNLKTGEKVKDPVKLANKGKTEETAKPKGEQAVAQTETNNAASEGLLTTLFGPSMSRVFGRLNDREANNAKANRKASVATAALGALTRGAAQVFEGVEAVSEREHRAREEEEAQQVFAFDGDGTIQSNGNNSEGPKVYNGVRGPELRRDDGSLVNPWKAMAKALTGEAIADEDEQLSLAYMKTRLAFGVRGQSSLAGANYQAGQMA